MMKGQNGATLVIILFILLLVTILGAIAVRSSLLGLSLATSHQVNALLLQNNDAALFNLEDQSKVSRQLAQDGMFGYFNSADSSDELVFCYRAAANQFFDMGHASIIAADGSYTKNGIEGFCTANQFATGRSAILSQVYLSKNTTPTTPLAGLPQGVSVGQSNVPFVSNHISATVISVLPSFADATNTQITACFKKTAIKKNDRVETVDECFSQLNIPYNVQHADYMVGGQPELSL